MKQVLHIFRKDTRRFWPEILASLIIIALYIVHFPSEWIPYADQSRRQMLLQITAALGVLTPLSWWLLIARVTHAETLVGDNEFWLTRPYEWKKLLAAKVLFILSWICLPFFLGQAALLAEAGFHPMSYISVLLFSLFAVSTIALLPLIAIAAVTANFARMTLTLLGILIVAVAFAFLMSLGSGRNGIFNPNQDTISLPFIFCLCGCVIAVVLQYATRRTWLTRVLLMVLPILITIIAFANGRQSVVDRAYPQPNITSTPPVMTDLDLNSPHGAVKARTWQGKDYLDFPIRYSGVVDGYAVFSENYKFSITAPDGTQWTSSWQYNNDRNLSGDNHSSISLPIDPAQFDRFKSVPVTLRITFALTRLQAGAVTNIPFPSGETFIPGIGICSPQFSRSETRWPGLYCRDVTGERQLTHLTALWSDVPCSETTQTPEGTLKGATWAGSLNPNESLTINSVTTHQIVFSNQGPNIYSNSPEARRWRLCPGTPLTITHYHLVDRTRTDLTIPNFHFPVTVLRTDSDN